MEEDASPSVRRSPDLLELDERDVLWADDPDSPSSAEDYPVSPPSRRRLRRERSGLSAALAKEIYVPVRMSAPVDVPGWGRKEGGWGFEGDGDEEGEVVGEMVPPHVLAARSHVRRFSVVEGAGRTLKGRDLRSVRNAVLRKTGFLD